MSYTIQRMTLEDLEQVYDIETRAHIAPWSKKIINDCIEVGYGCFVLIKRRKIRGFMIARATPGECHLLNLCIAPESQGKGFGEVMLKYLIEFVKPHCAKVILEVRPSNIPALKLYDKYKFNRTGYKTDYYSDPDGSTEDAIVLELRF